MTKGAKSMSEQNKAVVRRFLEAITKQDMAALGQVVDANIVIHSPPGMPTLRGLDALKQALFGFSSGALDLRATVEDALAEGDKVAARITLRGTHKGDFFGVPATGKQFTLTECNIYKIAGGKIVEEWPQADMLGVMQQLGAIPAPAQAGASPRR